jgi:hypothetical protein
VDEAAEGGTLFERQTRFRLKGDGDVIRAHGSSESESADRARSRAGARLPGTWVKMRLLKVLSLFECALERAGSSEDDRKWLNEDSLDIGGVGKEQNGKASSLEPCVTSLDDLGGKRVACEEH